ncbi:UNVERIFIED_CONTAM: hypothetical protein K2H54_031926 [Gekko kuhli]
MLVLVEVLGNLELVLPPYLLIDDYLDSPGQKQSPNPDKCICLLKMERFLESIIIIAIAFTVLCKVTETPNPSVVLFLTEAVCTLHTYQWLTSMGKKKIRNATAQNSNKKNPF